MKRLSSPNNIFFMWLLEIIFWIAAELCSWRTLLSLLVAIGIVVGLLYRYPEQDGLWSVSYPAAFIVIAFGIWRDYRAEHG